MPFNLQFMKPYYTELTFRNWAVLAVFHICFWIIVTTVGLNIVFGVILDTFSELRSMKVSFNIFIFVIERDFNKVNSILMLINHYKILL